MDDQADAPTLQTLVDPRPPVSDDAIYVALQNHKGNISAVARDLDRSPAVIRKRVKEHKELNALHDELRQAVIDKAEDNIFEAVEKGDLVQSALIVRTLGKDRGWSPRTEHTGENGAPMVVKIEGDAANV